MKCAYGCVPGWGDREKLSYVWSWVWPNIKYNHVGVVDLYSMYVVI